MFPYRVKYTECEYDIQNNDLLYNTLPKHQITFDFLKKQKRGKIRTKNKQEIQLFILLYVQIP